jgi:nucleotide-binding universal stress UspA family protein
MAYRRVCVAVALQRYLDFTPVTLRQRELVQMIAGGSGALVAALSVEAPVELLPDVETTAEKLERFARPLREAGLEVEIALRQGRPSRAITDFVRSWKADLLVLGTHAKRGPLDVGFGSTVSALPSDLEVPVVLIRPTAEEQRRASELAIPRYPVVFPYG